MSETCPASQGRGEGYSVHTDESEGLSATCYGQPLVTPTGCQLPLHRGAFAPLHENRSHDRVMVVRAVFHPMVSRIWSITWSVSYFSSAADMRWAPWPRMIICSRPSEVATRTRLSRLSW